MSGGGRLLHFLPITFMGGNFTHRTPGGECSQIRELARTLCHTSFRLGQYYTIFMIFLSPTKRHLPSPSTHPFSSNSPPTPAASTFRAASRCFCRSKPCASDSCERAESEAWWVDVPSRSGDSGPNASLRPHEHHGPHVCQSMSPKFMQKAFGMPPSLSPSWIT